MRQDFRPLSRIFALVAAALLGAATASAKEPEIGGLRLTLDERAAVEPLYHYRRDACDPHDLPDVPARAFRDAQGKIHLLATNYIHRAMVGDSFAALKKQCDVVYKPGAQPQPQLYDDKAWLEAFYTLDGITIHALVSADYHEYRHSKDCPFGADTNRCWYNVITAAVSTDGGRSFRTLLEPPAHYVAGPQVKFDLHSERSVGFFTTSNIVHYRGHYYTLAYTGGGFAQQRRGNCVLRTATLEDPASWRAWDGQGYTYTFKDAYKTGDRPDDAGCTPVAPNFLNASVRSVLLHKPSGLFVAILLTTGSTRETRDARGVYYALSRVLTEWSRPLPLFIAPTRAEVKRLSDGKSTASVAIDYPALIDHASPGDNFEVLAGEPYLYYVELPVANGKLTGERTLMRRRLVITN
jgi:hypothetical protein